MEKSILSNRNVLLVIAHPDDEAMFYSPFLLYCQSQSLSISLSLLCLSDGNAEGKGAIRRQELYRSTSYYGINKHDVTIVDHKELQDGMENRWSSELISEIIRDYVESMWVEKGRLVDVIVGFDHYGVSGHPNHISCYHGLILAHDSLKRFFRKVLDEISSDGVDKGLTDEKVVDEDDVMLSFRDENDSLLRPSEERNTMRLFKLSSVSLVRKFSGMADIPFTHLTQYFRDWRTPKKGYSGSGSRRLLFHNFRAMRAMRGMRCHASQLTWYRTLFMLFSRYSYINELEEISLPNCFGKKP